MNNEMAGREVGRMRRFLPESLAQRDVRRQREREAHHWSALMRMLRQDAEYRALYDTTMETLWRAETATEVALEKASDVLEAAKQELHDIIDRANSLPDGTTVFRDSNGNVWSEHGDLITSGTVDQIEWRDGTSSYQTYLNQKQAIEEAQGKFDEILRYRVDVLGKARHRLMDEDNPPTKDELREIQKDIDEQAPDAVKRESEPDNIPDTNKSAPAFETDIPKL